MRKAFTRRSRLQAAVRVAPGMPSEVCLRSLASSCQMLALRTGFLYRQSVHEPVVAFEEPDESIHLNYKKPKSLDQTRVLLSYL